MKHRHLWLGTAVIALLTLSSPASAQYISRYQSSDSPNVEVNLDILNDRAEQEYKAQHDVAAEPLAPVSPVPAYVPVMPPKAAPAPVAAPIVAPVAVPVTARVQPVPQPMQHSLPPAMPSYPPATAAAMPAPQQKRRLLKPVFTAGTVAAPAPQKAAAPQTAPATKYDVRHTELPPSDPSELMPEPEMEANLAVEEAVAEPPAEITAAAPVRMASIPLPRHKPGGAKRSWSAVDGTPAPAYLADGPKPPVVMAAVETKKAPAPSAAKNEMAETEAAETEVSALKADEEAPPPAAPEQTAEKTKPAPVAAPETSETNDAAKDETAEAADTPPPVMMAQADIAAPAATPAPERAPIISRRPRLSDEMPDHVPAQPLVTQAYPTAPITSQKPVLSNEAKITPPPAVAPVPAPTAAIDDDWSAPVPTRPSEKKPETKRPSLIVTQGDDNKPAIPAPLPDVTAPVATQNETPLAVPPGDNAAPDINQLPPPDQSAMDAPEPTLTPPETLPVVPTLADLTLDFAGNSSDLTAQAQRKLDAVIVQLNDSTEGRLQVRGYASGDGSTATARRIALSRVLAVRSYLMDKGIKPARVDVHARGALTDGDTRAADRVDLIFAR